MLLARARPFFANPPADLFCLAAGYILHTQDTGEVQADICPGPIFRVGAEFRIAAATIGQGRRGPSEEGWLAWCAMSRSLGELASGPPDMQRMEADNAAFGIVCSIFGTHSSFSIKP